jgi:hypothetical protein
MARLMAGASKILDPVTDTPAVDRAPAMALILLTSAVKDFAQRQVANAQTSNRRSLPWACQGELVALASNPGAGRLTSSQVFRAKRKRNASAR